MAFKKHRYSTRRATTRSNKAKGGRPWTRQDVAFLRKNYRTNATKWVARQLGRTAYSVRYKASSLSIKKAKPSIWRANTRTNRPSQSRFHGAPKTRWASSIRRISRKARPRRRTRSSRW